MGHPVGSCCANDLAPENRPGPAGVNRGLAGASPSGRYMLALHRLSRSAGRFWAQGQQKGLHSACKEHLMNISSRAVGGQLGVIDVNRQEFRKEDRAGFESIDERRIQAARDAAITSFFNRYGRMPTEWDVAQSIVHFLPADLRTRALLAVRRIGEAETRQTESAPPSEEPLVPDFGSDAARWLPHRRYGRPPTDEEVRRATDAYSSSGASGQMQINVDPESLSILRLPSLRAPPFERVPLGGHAADISAALHLANSPLAEPLSSA